MIPAKKSGCQAPQRRCRVTNSQAVQWLDPGPVPGLVMIQWLDYPAQAGTRSQRRSLRPPLSPCRHARGRVLGKPVVRRYLRSPFSCCQPPGYRVDYPVPCSESFDIAQSARSGPGVRVPVQLRIRVCCYREGVPFPDLVRPRREQAPEAPGAAGISLRCPAVAAPDGERVSEGDHHGAPPVSAGSGMPDAIDRTRAAALLTC